MQANENNTMNAQETISELLNNNKALLNNGINESTIENIVENCRVDGKNEKYMKLLSSLQECNNEAIPGNQDFVCTFILEDDKYKHLLIKVAPAGNGFHYAIFEDEEMMLANGNKPVKIKIDELHGYFTQKKDMILYNYFQSMINMLSIMCLNRNLSGYSKIQYLYSLDFIVDSFLNEKISYGIRANLGKLLLTAHIDKDPLELLSIPKLARLWRDVNIANKNQ